MVPENSLDDALRALVAPGGVVDDARVLRFIGGPEERHLIDMAITHRLHATLVDVLERSGAPVDERLGALAVADRVVRLRLKGVLSAAASALDSADVPWLVFKGPAVAASMPRPELRTYNDLDLLVAANRFADSIDALATVGITEVNRNWEPYVRYRVGEVPMVGAGVTVDLHWHLIGLRRDRVDLRLDPAEMLARRRRRMVDDRELSIFDPEDQLLHLAIHSALSGATRLDQLRDLCVGASAESLDWEAYVRRARASGAARLTGHALDRAVAVVGADVPVEILVDLAGAGPLARRRRLDGEAVATLRGLGVHWRRDTARASLRAALVRLGDSLPRLGRRQVGWDFATPDSRLYFARETGGGPGREAFLRGVAGWD